MSDIRAVVFESTMAVTLSDTAPSPRFVYSAFYVGTAGNVTITDANGSKVTLVGCLAGTIYPIAAQQFWATGTSAQNLVALSARPYSGVGT